MNRRLFWFVPAVLATASLAFAAPEAEGPKVDRPGRTVVRYTDSAAQVVVGYRWTNANFSKAPWLLFEVAVTATGGKPVTVNREDIAFLTPSGERLPLPGQKRMSEGIPDLTRLLAEAAISRDPIDGYFPFATESERIRFFVAPGKETVIEEFTVTGRILAQGDLFFEAPSGKLTPGSYTLEIRNKTLSVKVPILLPAPELGKEAKGQKPGEKTVPW